MKNATNGQVSSSKKETIEPGSLQIVVMDRGWVYLGRVTVDGDMVTIEDAQNVRRWGTSAGLGELAAKGPLRDTKLDPYGTVVAPIKAVIHFIACTFKSNNT